MFAYNGVLKGSIVPSKINILALSKYCSSFKISSNTSHSVNINQNKAVFTPELAIRTACFAFYAVK
jgi:hypothetical protein